MTAVLWEDHAMPQSDNTRAGRALPGTPPDLAELAQQVGCDDCDADGLCASCRALASLIQTEIRIRQQRD